MTRSKCTPEEGVGRSERKQKGQIRGDRSREIKRQAKFTHHIGCRGSALKPLSTILKRKSWSLGRASTISLETLVAEEVE